MVPTRSEADCGARLHVTHDLVDELATILGNLREQFPKLHSSSLDAETAPSPFIYYFDLKWEVDS